MKECMKFFQEQIFQSFLPDDTYMNSLKEDDIEDDEETILASEGQGDEVLDYEEDKHSSTMDIHDLQERKLVEFWASMNEEKQRRPKNKP